MTSPVSARATPLEAVAEPGAYTPPQAPIPLSVSTTEISLTASSGMVRDLDLEHCVTAIGDDACVRRLYDADWLQEVGRCVSRRGQLCGVRSPGALNGDVVFVRLGNTGLLDAVHRGGRNRAEYQRESLPFHRVVGPTRFLQQRVQTRNHRVGVGLRGVESDRRSIRVELLQIAETSLGIRRDGHINMAVRVIEQRAEAERDRRVEYPDPYGAKTSGLAGFVFHG